MAMHRARESFTVCLVEGEPEMAIRAGKAYSDDDPALKRLITHPAYAGCFESETAKSNAR